jgi:hypothetical protein
MDNLSDVFAKQLGEIIDDEVPDIYAMANRIIERNNGELD